MKHTLSGVVLLLVVFGIFGCGDTAQEAILTPVDGAPDLFGAVKQPTDLAPAAPSMPGTPRVTAVGFYKDWQLTEAVDSATPGTTVFVKITFSKPMRHVVSDGKQARPVLYYQVAGEQKRFTIAPHGAKGKDFVSGDAKPLGKGTTKFIGKLKVSHDTTISIGKWSVDVQGNPLAKFYTHSEVLVVPSELSTTASEPLQKWIVNGNVIGEILPPSAWVLAFPGPYREHQPPASHPTDFVGQVCMYVAGDVDPRWAETKGIAPVSGVTVTITDGPRRGEQVRTDEGGYYLFPRVSGNELYLRVEKAYLEPREVIVYRSHATKLQKMKLNEVFVGSRHAPQYSKSDPGVILMGLRWPDAIRPVLEHEPMPHYHLWCVIGVEQPLTATGAYGGGHLSLINGPEYRNEMDYGTLLHELTHARQDAVSIMHGLEYRDWEDTPEGKSYAKAWEKDLEQSPSPAGPIPWLDGKGTHFGSSVSENAAEFCALFWDLELGLGTAALLHHPIVLDNIRERSPHRFKWAEQYLNVK